MKDALFWYLGVIWTYGFWPVVAVQAFGILAIGLMGLAVIDRIEGRQLEADDTDREEIQR